MKKFFLSFLFIFCSVATQVVTCANLKLGADKLDELLPRLKNQRVALVVNQTSILSNGIHLLDALLEKEVDVKKVFAPEHGFRGTADAGEKIIGGKDPKTGIMVVSLYGNNTKPTIAQMTDVDIVLFDIQDVGARFYTYISTMHYVMEACAENGKEFIVLDRPNPNDYVDGPILDLRFKSFVGMHPIPVLHGLTIGELASMINGEGWLKDKTKCNLVVITMSGWKHGQPYSLPIKPSPNLPNNQSVKLYASLCFFEATNISVGRGTDYPFQVIGFPNAKFGTFTFTPSPASGAKNPLQNGKKCYGIDLRTYKFDGGLDLSFLIDFYKKSGQGASFFTSPKFMDMLAGSSELRTQITNDVSENEIKQSWQANLGKYKTTRAKYLLY